MLLARRKTYVPAANTMPGISTGWSNVTIVFLSHSSAFAFDGNNVISIATPIIAIAIRNVFIVYLQIILIRFLDSPHQEKLSLVKTGDYLRKSTQAGDQSGR